MTTLRLEVEKSYPNDSGRGIARLDPNTFSHLGLTPGDHIEVKGNDTTVATVWRADKQDWDTGLVRIDGFTRQNSDVYIGECVEISKVEVTHADSLTLRSFKESPVQFRSDAVDLVERQLLRRAFLEGDMVPIMWNPVKHSREPPRQAIALLAAVTEPKGPVIVVDETTITIREASE